MKKFIFSVFAVIVLCFLVYFNQSQRDPGSEQEVVSWNSSIMEFSPPLEVVQQEIEHHLLPAPVWSKFPLKDFEDHDPSMPITMVPPGDTSFGYGMDSMGCVAKALLEKNAISYWENTLGIAGGQYAYNRLVPVEDPLVYDPTQYAFYIHYGEAYLEIRFPALYKMVSRKLEPPDEAVVQECLDRPVF